MVKGQNIQRCSYQTKLNLLIHLKFQFYSFQQNIAEEEDTVSSKAFWIVILQVWSSPENVGKAHLWNVGLTLQLHDYRLVYVWFYMLEASSLPALLMALAQVRLTLVLQYLFWAGATRHIMLHYFRQNNLLLAFYHSWLSKKPPPTQLPPKEKKSKTQTKPPNQQPSNKNPNKLKPLASSSAFAGHTYPSMIFPGFVTLSSAQIFKTQVPAIDG